MKGYLWWGILPLMCLLLGSPSVLWGDAGKISGYFFGDYYYVLKSHNAELEERNGFQYRRIYFNYDKGLSDSFSVRFRFEMNGAAFPTDRQKIEPYVKNGYLRWKRPQWRTNLYLGLCSNPTWKNVEGVWGYRPVTETPLHLHKMGNGSDFGVALQGDIDKSKKVSYHLIFANGTSTSGEIDGNKKVAFSLAVKPVKGLILEGYADLENAVDRGRWYTLQGFLGYQHEQFRFGAQLANQTRERDDKNILVSSVFGAAQLLEKKVWAFARFDRLSDPSPAANRGYIHFDDTAAPNMILVGLDWKPMEALNIMPNLVFVFYDEPDKGAKSDATIMPRLTAFFTF